ncbi:hypothetical protein OJAV_G00217720 [Oryzias javanicus]|uniref:Uncharacterized protein n=1 Tax=Oryzias javanicus TaxID=123683 RepID=A0A437C4S1_ORYJA|nr:hypothetical protein OJAV_G00217720 [Oryzias javanicus]
MSQEGGGAEAGEPGGSARPHRTGSDSPEVNGQHRPASPAGGGVSSDAEEEEAGLSPGDGRPQSEKGAAKKRTHVGARPSSSSPSEKKLKT